MTPINNFSVSQLIVSLTSIPKKYLAYDGLKYPSPHDTTRNNTLASVMSYTQKINYDKIIKFLVGYAITHIYFLGLAVNSYSESK